MSLVSWRMKKKSRNIYMYIGMMWGGDRSLQRLAFFEEGDRGRSVARSYEIKGLSE